MSKGYFAWGLLYYCRCEEKKHLQYFLQKFARHSEMYRLIKIHAIINGVLPALSNQFCIVLLGLALGRNGGLINNMYLPFWLGLGGHIGSGKQFFPWVHVQDVVGIIHHAITSPTVHGILNAVAPHTNTNAEFTTTFAQAMWRWACIPVPEFILSIIFGSERTKVMTTGAKIVPQRTLESGYAFHYPDLNSACREIVNQSPFAHYQFPIGKDK